jgi:hypothetical protein
MDVGDLEAVPRDTRLWMLLARLIGTVDGRMGTVGGWFGTVDGWFGTVDGRMGTVGGRMGTVGGSLHVEQIRELSAVQGTMGS